MNESIKNLPVTELTIAAVAVILGFNPDIGEGGAVDWEMEVLNQLLWDNFKPQNKANRCACCGHALKYSCAVVHMPTGNGYWIGRSCAANIESLKLFGKAVERCSVALAQRIACNKREADFLSAHPESMSIIAWCKLPRAPKIARDMLEKMRRYGDLSEKQITTLESIRTKDEERRKTATGKALAGRQSVKGTVVSWKKVPGFNPKDEVIKLTLDLGNGVRAFGNAPSYNNAGQPLFPRKGDEVQFTATFEPSKNDDLFGFWKRPAKFTITKYVAEDAAAWEAIFTANPGLKELPAGYPRTQALFEAARKAAMKFDDSERFVYENFNP